MNDKIICVSCRTVLPRNVNNTDFDCYCPVCGERMKVSGDKVDLFEDCSADHTEPSMDIRSQLRDCVKAGDRQSIDKLMLELKSRMSVVEGIELLGEVNYHIYRQIPELCRSYIFLKAASLAENPVIETQEYYRHDLAAFDCMSGVREFDPEAVSALIKRCKPEDADYEEFAVNFCSSAIFLAKSAKKMRLARINPRVRSDIFDYASENDLSLISALPGAFMNSIMIV